MDDAELFFSRSEAVHGIHKCAIDGQRTLTPSGDEQAQRISRLTRGNGKEFGTYGAAGNDGFFSPCLRRNFIASGNALRKARQEFVGEARLGVRLKNNVGHTSQPRRQHHGPRCVAANAKRGDRLVLAQDAARVKHGRNEHGQILEQRCPALAF